MAHETDTVTPSTGDVFRDLGFDAKEAQDLRLRSDLMIALRQQIASRKLPQARIATLLGVSQPRVSDLLRGKIHLFGLDTLVKMLARFGATVDVSVHAPATPLAPAQMSGVTSTITCSATTIVGLAGVAALTSLGLSTVVASTRICVPPEQAIDRSVVGNCFVMTTDYLPVGESAVQCADDAHTQYALAA